MQKTYRVSLARPQAITESPLIPHAGAQAVDRTLPRRKPSSSHSSF
jgi:hypothetical protein